MADECFSGFIASEAGALHDQREKVPIIVFPDDLGRHAK
jgi:hypothetical protein